MSLTEIGAPALRGGWWKRPLCGAIRGADVGLQENVLEDGLERRGRVYYMRMRVPARFAEVEPRAEVNLSLKTRDEDQARARLAIRKRALMLDWEARLRRRANPDRPEAYDAAMGLLRDLDIPYVPMETLLSGPIADLVQRIEALGAVKPESPAAPAALGALKPPAVRISEMPAIIEELNKKRNENKNPRQMREWRNKYRNAAAVFVTVVADKPVLEITEPDALAYRTHWKNKIVAGEVTVDHVVKRLRFARHLIDAYYERFEIPPSQRNNPFNDLTIEDSLRPSISSGEARKLALPAPWVRRVLIEQNGLDDLNAEARDIATIAAECGARQSEIYDLPPDAIRLEHPIPHIMLDVSEDAEARRDLKNAASRRPVVLLGASLDAMRRHPGGFPRYRGKANYSATVNKYLRQNGLFPKPPAGEKRLYTLGCTRHTFEDRMSHAQLSNEERAYLMGHSVGRVRGRPVYGSDPDLRMRALLQEMVAFPTSRWTPRPIAVLREEVGRLAAELGFRHD